MNDVHLQGADRLREIFARVRAGDLAVADLYSPDAVLVPGNGARVEGRDAIRAFYEGVFANTRPHPQVQAVLESPPYYVAVLDVRTGDTSRRVLDLIELADDGIRSMEIFTQG